MDRTDPVSRLRSVAVAAASRLGPSPWAVFALLAGAAILLARLWWSTPTLGERVVRDLTLFVAAPLALGAVYGKSIGWTVNRRAVLDALYLAAFVTPFYIVGSTLPTIREYYPLWSTATALDSFLPHAVQLFLLALAAETYYRGLLCVGLREFGFKCVFVSPVVYALMHSSKPPIEFLLSGPTDVLFGAVDYRSGSILPSTVAHGCGLVLLDWLVLHDPVLPPEQVLRALDWLPVAL